MNYIDIIQEEINEFQEGVRKKYIRHLNVIVVSSVFIVGIYHAITDDPFYLAYLLVAGSILLFFSLMVFTKMRYYKLLTNIEFFIISLVIAWSVLSIQDYFHFQEALWNLVIIFSTFFVLGRGWGYFYLSFNAFIYILYFKSDIFDGLLIPQSIEPVIMLIWTVETAVVIWVIGYIMIQNKKINSYGVERTLKIVEKIKQEKAVIDQQNNEKADLLLEVHHRVRNNLQIIVQLLTIQSRQIKTEKEGFQIAINRINAMALVHQHTYETDHLKDTDVKEYLTKLIKSLTQTIDVEQTISLNVEINVQAIKAERLMIMGLIINELTSNSLKHAFRNSTAPPCISLTIKRNEKQQIVINFADNGSWKESSSSSIGLELVDAFTDQIDGRYERVISSDGTKYHFLFEQNNQTGRIDHVKK